MADVLPAFSINGVTIPSPTSAQWTIPPEKGVDGTGQKRYTGYFGFTLTWVGMTQADYNTLYTTWLGHYGSGTAVVRLPQFNTTTYQFTYYSGCVFDLAVIGSPYDSNYLTSVKLEIRKITV